MAKTYHYGEDNQERTRRVLEVLLTYSDEGIDRGKIKCLKTGKGINFEISKQDLIDLITARYKSSDWDNDIRPALSHYLGWLGILQDNRTATRGSSMWKFSLNLWCDDTEENLKRFNEEWAKKSPDRQKKSVREDSQPKQSQIDWLDRSRQLLAAQKHLTTNRLLKESTRNFDDIHVPLGLIERKERPKVKEEPSPEQGSQLYQTEYTETKRFEHEAFLAEVVGKPAGGKHIAIIGEPGAGKTTILTKIGAWLIGQAEQQPEEPLVVAWISLADVGDRRLQAYLRDEWLQKVCEDNFDAAWEDWKGLRQQGRVWLLLDGLDEMSGDALAAIHRDLGQAWAQNLRVVMTCRLNQWETAAGGNILTNSFDVYRTLDYSYRTSQGEDQVQEFISKWFTDREKVATQIRTELDAPGKERIKDLVKNPLRLTLLCASWEKDNEALPETQADLYRGFVNYLYNWKAKEFSDEVELRQELDLALGELAKAGLNRQPINDGAVRRFRFTASEISNLWKDRSDTLIPAAKNLGWLNVVGEEAGEAVYAFYHPTFQEYFAACSVDDWDYFMPKHHEDRPVPCQGETVPTYRIFEQEWRQVILLWIGRNDHVVTDGVKEEFIYKLTNFQDNFYYYRAYCMAAICVGEFRSSRQAKAIVHQIVELAFDYSNTEKQKWTTFPNPIPSLAREAIIFTHRGYTINILIDLLKNKNLSDDVRSDLTIVLHGIDPSNTCEINSVIAMTKDKYLSNSLRYNIALNLSEIAEDPRIIDILIDLLKDEDLDDLLRHKVVLTLGKTTAGNLIVVNKLIDALKDKNLNKALYYNIALALSEVCVKGNSHVIDILVDILKDKASDGLLRYNITLVLGKVDPGNSIAIAVLIKSLDNKNSNGLRCSFVRLSSEIANNNPLVIAILIDILKNENTCGSLSYSIVQALGRIAIGNSIVIATLIDFLKNEHFNKNFRFNLAASLGKIDTGNLIAITTLTELLKSINLDDRLDTFPMNIVETLGEIAKGNPQVLSFLITIFQDKNSNNRLGSVVLEALGKILTKELMPSIIKNLKNNITDEVYMSNLEKFKACYKIHFQCARTLTYPEFHAAWHQTHLPISPFSPQNLDNNKTAPTPSSSTSPP